MSNLTMSSVEIAKSSGKDHIDVLRSISRMIRELGDSGFEAATYTDHNGEAIQGYELDAVNVSRLARYYADFGSHYSLEVIDAMTRKVKIEKKKLEAESKEKFREIYTGEKKAIDDDFKSKLKELENKQKELKNKHKKNLANLKSLYKELM